MTLTADTRGDALTGSHPRPAQYPRDSYESDAYRDAHGDDRTRQNARTVPVQTHEDRPVEFWPTSAIRAAFDRGDLTVWQNIVVAVRRDPYGRTARQVEEVLDTSEQSGVCNAMNEVLTRSRAQLEAAECAEVARHVRQLLERSGLGRQEFASRCGIPTEDLTTFLEATVSPPASLMIRMRRLSDRFAKLKAQRCNR